MAVAEYKVLTSAITVKLSKDSKKVARVLRGRIVKLDDEFVDVAKLIRLKAIGVRGTKGLKPTTARVLAAAAGAPGDPVASPDAVTNPIDPEPLAPPVEPPAAPVAPAE